MELMKESDGRKLLILVSSGIKIIYTKCWFCFIIQFFQSLSGVRKNMSMYPVYLYIYVCICIIVYMYVYMHVYTWDICILRTGYKYVHA